MIVNNDRHEVFGEFCDLNIDSKNNKYFPEIFETKVEAKNVVNQMNRNLNVNEIDLKFAQNPIKFEN